MIYEAFLIEKGQNMPVSTVLGGQGGYYRTQVNILIAALVA